MPESIERIRQPGEGGNHPPKTPSAISGAVPQPRKDNNSYLDAIGYSKEDLEKLRKSFRDTYELDR